MKILFEYLEYFDFYFFVSLFGIYALNWINGWKSNNNVEQYFKSSTFYTGVVDVLKWFTVTPNSNTPVIGIGNNSVVLEQAVLTDKNDSMVVKGSEKKFGLNNSVNNSVVLEQVVLTDKNESMVVKELEEKSGLNNSLVHDLGVANDQIGKKTMSKNEVNFSIGKGKESVIIGEVQNVKINITVESANPSTLWLLSFAIFVLFMSVICFFFYYKYFPAATTISSSTSTSSPRSTDTNSTASSPAPSPTGSNTTQIPPRSVGRPKKPNRANLDLNKVNECIQNNRILEGPVQRNGTEPDEEDIREAEAKNCLLEYKGNGSWFFVCTLMVTRTWNNITITRVCACDIHQCRNCGRRG